MKDLVVTIFIELAKLVVVTILLWYFGSDIQYEIIRRLNTHYKNSFNTLVAVDFSRYSDNLYNITLENGFQEKIQELAINSNMKIHFNGNDIEIIEMEYGKSKYNGKILFSFHDYEKLKLSKISLLFSKECGYKNLHSEIFSLVQAVNYCEVKLLSKLDDNIQFHNELETKLSNLSPMTNVFKILNRVSKDIPFSYLFLKDKMFVEIDNDTLVLREQIDDVGLDLFKEMVTMYQ